MSKVDYNAIANVVSDDPLVFDNVPNGSCLPFTWTYYPPNAPSNFQSSYTPTSITKWKNQPDGDNDDSFSAIKASGSIKMTPYSVGTITVKRFLASHDYIDWTLGYPHCSTDGATLGEVAVATRWQRLFTIEDSLTAKMNGQLALDEDAHNKARNDAMSRCVSDAQTTLDALTNAAEGPETIEFIVSMIRAARKPLETYAKTVARLKASPLTGAEDLADAWLAFRYAIMPIILTVNDAMQLADEKGYLFTSSRGFGAVTARKENLYDFDPTKYINYDVQGETVYRATCKSRYSSSGGKVFSKTSINPFLTAWELVPFSFVVDWFINVGDVILGMTFNLSDPSVTRQFCLSKKTNTTETWTYNRNQILWAEKVYGPPTNHTVRREESFTSKQLLQTTVVDTYERSLFKPSDIDLSWSLDLSILQKLDAIALTVGPILQFFRSLKLIR